MFRGMTRSPLAIDRLIRAVATDAPPPGAGGTSDFELNPGLRAFAPEGGLRAAAVLCGVVDRGEGLRVILTRRADHLNAHAGQVAFPGGKRDPSDPSLAHAALREAEEEIGLPPSMVRLLGRIDGHETGTGFAITPYVGLVDPRFEPRPHPGEVAEVFEPPLDFLMDPANRRRESRMFKGAERHFYAIPWEGRYIWGATARILIGLADRIAASVDGAGDVADQLAAPAGLPGEGLRPAADPRARAAAGARPLDRRDMPPRGGGAG